MTHGSIPLITGEGVLGTFGWQEIDPRGEMWKWTRIVATAARARGLTENEWKSRSGTKVTIGFVRCFLVSAHAVVWMLPRSWKWLSILHHFADNANDRFWGNNCQECGESWNWNSFNLPMTLYQTSVEISMCWVSLEFYLFHHCIGGIICWTYF